MMEAYGKEAKSWYTNRLRLRMAAVATFLIFSFTAAFVIQGFPQCTTTHTGDLILRGNEILVNELPRRKRTGYQEAL